MMFRTANPALHTDTFLKIRAASGEQAMTIQGTVNRAFFMLFLLLATASYTWGLFFKVGTPSAVMPWMIGGLIGGLILILLKKGQRPVHLGIWNGMGPLA